MDPTPVQPNAVNVDQLFSQRGRLTLQIALLQNDLNRVDLALQPFIQQGQPQPVK